MNTTGERAGEGGLAAVEEAVRDIAADRAVVVVEDADRENEGDLVLAAEKVTEAHVAFMMTQRRGLICAPMEGARLDHLALGPMVARNSDPRQTAFTVSVDATAAHGVGTGISAADRTTTLRLLARSGHSSDFARPGHVFPLRARPEGILPRAGHTEAAVDLARLAGLFPAGVLVEIVGPDGRMLRLPDLVPFARRHDLKIISIAYRCATEPRVRRESVARLPTLYGEFTAYGYRSPVDGIEHLALVRGDVADDSGAPTAVPVRLHSECLTGDLFESLQCDCGDQLCASLRTVAAEGRGVVVYLRGHEGCGIGLTSKLRAYELRESGWDTVDANLELGLDADARDYRVGADILRDLDGHGSAPAADEQSGQVHLFDRLRIQRAQPGPAAGPGRVHNRRYLRTKRDRMSHDLPWLDRAAPGGTPPEAAGGA
ncbi:3,4-dihydroxy-2-butanone-4-phosphate synthase [Streptomyces sp. NPDC059003]|uniref:3,4-dihydroxy-2-butanone-4-phosphate synthase n=1 Tax=Streptomyces sp. NPDC059003 TaxID=3346691 RepID=UPI0036B03D6F